MVVLVFLWEEEKFVSEGVLEMKVSELIVQLSQYGSEDEVILCTEFVDTGVCSYFEASKVYLEDPGVVCIECGNEY